MATQHLVLETHNQHPNWNANDIARALNCSAGYVRATAHRLKITLPSAQPESIEALGHAARDAGLTVADIHALAKLRIPALAAVVAAGLIGAVVVAGSAIASHIAGASL